MNRVQNTLLTGINFTAIFLSIEKGKFKHIHVSDKDNNYIYITHLKGGNGVVIIISPM